MLSGMVLFPEKLRLPTYRELAHVKPGLVTDAWIREGLDGLMMVLDDALFVVLPLALTRPRLGALLDARGPLLPPLKARLI